MPWNDLHRQPKMVLKHYFGASLHYSVYYICTLNALLPSSFCPTRKIIQHTVFLFKFTLCTRQKNTYFPSTVPKNSPWSEPVIISSFPTKYNTRPKSLKQEPFALNFLQISYSHSWHLSFWLKFAPLLPQCWATRILEQWDNCNTKINVGEGENHTSVSRFATSIVFALGGRGRVTKRMKGNYFHLYC